jgi:signal transduction histidine kinase
VRRSETVSIFAGFVFGSLPLYLTSDPFDSLIFSCLFTVSMCAGLMCVLPRNPRLVVRYLTGSTAPLMVHVVLHFNDRMVAIAIALLLLVFTIYFGARAAFKLYLKEVRSVEEATQLREILEVALDGSGQAFAVRSKDGKIIFENELYKQVHPALRNVEASSGVVHVLDRYWQTASYEVDSIGSVEIFTDVTRIEDARQEAESLRQEADEASHAKTRFLRSVTSELLVPLRTIRLQASMMDAGSRIPVTKAEMNRAADQIRLLTESLESRVEQIIGYASGDATQADLASNADLRDNNASPVLKLESFLRRSLREGSGG